MTFALVVLCAVGAQADAPVVVFRERSPYAEVFVVDEGPLRALRFDAIDGDDQTVIDKRDPARVPVEYVRLAAAGLAFTPGRARALVVGTGGGAFPMLLRRAFPRMAVDAVDIDPVVLKAAQAHFGLVADDRLRLHARDGAAYVRATKRRYDLVLLDAYSGDGVPAHLAGAPFFRAVRGVVAKGGVVVANVAVDADEERAIVAAFARAFATCTAIRGREGGNVVLIGAARAPVDVAAAIGALRVPFSPADDVATIEGC